MFNKSSKQMTRTAVGRRTRYKTTKASKGVGTKKLSNNVINATFTNSVESGSSNTAAQSPEVEIADSVSEDTKNSEETAENPNQPQTRRKRTITLSQSAEDKVRMWAAGERLTVSQVIENLIEQHIE